MADDDPYDGEPDDDDLNQDTTDEPDPTAEDGIDIDTFISGRPDEVRDGLESGNGEPDDDTQEEHGEGDENTDPFAGMTEATGDAGDTVSDLMDETGLDDLDMQTDTDDMMEQLGESLREIAEQMYGDMADRETHPLATARAKIASAQRYDNWANEAGGQPMQRDDYRNAVEAAEGALEAVQNMELNAPDISGRRARQHAFLYMLSPVTGAASRLTDPEELGETMDDLQAYAVEASQEVLMQAMMGGDEMEQPSEQDIAQEALQSYGEDTLDDYVEGWIDAVEEAERQDLVDRLHDLSDRAYDMEAAGEALESYIDELESEHLQTAEEEVTSAIQYERDVQDQVHNAKTYPLDVTAAALDQLSDTQFEMVKLAATSYLRSQLDAGDGDNGDDYGGMGGLGGMGGDDLYNDSDGSSDLDDLL